MTKFKDRCSCLASSTNRRCKLSGKNFNILNKNYCYTHANMLFSKSADIIKRAFDGFLVRKKLKNIFYLLPDDLQRKIIGFIREPHYIKQQHHKPIQRILEKRYEEQMLYQKYNLHYPFIGNPQFHGDILAIAPNKAVEYYTKIVELYNLHSKYIEIANIDNCMALCRFATQALTRMDRNINGGYIPIDTDMRALKTSLHAAIKNFINRCKITHTNDISSLSYIYRIPYMHTYL